MLEKAIHGTAQKKTEAAPEQTSRVKMALLIFAYFIKIGSFTFGSGWSILAQMEQEFVDKRRWLGCWAVFWLCWASRCRPWWC